MPPYHNQSWTEPAGFRVPVVTGLAGGSHRVSRFGTIIAWILAGLVYRLFKQQQNSPRCTPKRNTTHITQIQATGAQKPMHRIVTVSCLVMRKGSLKPLNMHNVSPDCKKQRRPWLNSCPEMDVTYIPQVISVFHRFKLCNLVCP